MSVVTYPISPRVFDARKAINESIPTISVAQEAWKTRRAGHDLPVYMPHQTSQGEEVRLRKGIRLVEIFDSPQGEGLNCGELMTFVRFSKCNLACDFCDTPFNRVAIELSEEELISNLVGRRPKWVIFTGGEPMLQLTVDLVQRLQAEGILIACESNGMVYNEALHFIDHVTFSPKLYRTSPGDCIPQDRVIAPETVKGIQEGKIKVKELRYLICGAKDNMFRLPEDVHLNAECWVLSPLFMDGTPSPDFVSGVGHRSATGKVDPDSFRRVMSLLSLYRDCNARMSVQVHKLIGVR